jgi:chromosome segregation ATPase
MTRQAIDERDALRKDRDRHRETITELQAQLEEVRKENRGLWTELARTREVSNHAKKLAWGAREALAIIKVYAPEIEDDKALELLREYLTDYYKTKGEG